ncbi:uncharacterized protein LOC127848126 [Dreissena polymorpha]|uniref:Endonuclease/exonuclease/phosphatase domain-containing protein n=1 Tax=Dreissena polymorpha TaxID=45954 RepID=A0A9D4DPJ5_DREPO|nr:uncharacterized protein LOC127848126 [Dreissena polymorpha]KAH3752718.1 hypothetical protein DPMN_187344 [Dreissena polymorpha]
MTMRPERGKAKKMYLPTQTTMNSESNTDDPSESNNVTKISEIDGGGDAKKQVKDVKVKPSRQKKPLKKINKGPVTFSAEEIVKKEGPLSLNAPTIPNVQLLIINVKGNGKGKSEDDDHIDPPESRRRNAISNIIHKYKPDVVLFQEFTWVGITGNSWIKWPIPDNYAYLGNTEASIMSDSRHVVVWDVPAADIDNILTELKRTSNNRLEQLFPTDFTPVSRMCLKRMMVKTKPVLDFICVSWHGPSKKLTLEEKIVFFKYLMEFLRHIKDKYNIAMLIGGDFNINMESIKHIDISPFKLCEYKASERRIGRIIDFYIVSDEITLDNIQWVDLERDTDVVRPNKILDHDPVLATLKPSLEAMAFMDTLWSWLSNLFGFRNAVSDTESNWLNLERDTTVVSPNEIPDHDPVLGTLKPILEVERSAAYVNERGDSESKSKGKASDKMAFMDTWWLRLSDLLGFRR